MDRGRGRDGIERDASACGHARDARPFDVAGRGSALLGAIALAMASHTILPSRARPSRSSRAWMSSRRPRAMRFRLRSRTTGGSWRLSPMETKGSQLWLRPLDQVRAQPLAGTEGAGYPFWAPDGRAIGFFADGKLKRIDLDRRRTAGACRCARGAWRHMESRRCHRVRADAAVAH